MSGGGTSGAMVNRLRGTIMVLASRFAWASGGRHG
jgi:hypothetical protein